VDRANLIKGIRIAIDRNLGGILEASKIIGESFAKKQECEDINQNI
jgi:hypothetical protein